MDTAQKLANNLPNQSKLNADLLTAIQTDYIKNEAQLSAVKAAIEAGANVNARGTFNNSALILAAEKGYSEIVSYLLTVQGINPGHKNNYGNTALMLAAANGRVKTVEALVSYGNLNVNNNIEINATVEMGATALMKAAGRGHSEVVFELLKARGILINQRNYYKGTALSLAIESKCTSAALILLNYDDIEIDDLGWINYQNALSLSARYRETKVIEALVSKHANKIKSLVNRISGFSGETTLRILAQNGDLLGVTALLSIEGIDIFEGSPISEARRGGHMEIVNLLESRCTFIAKLPETENKSPQSALPTIEKPTPVVSFSKPKRRAHPKEKDPKLLSPQEYEKILARGLKAIDLKSEKKGLKPFKRFTDDLEPKKRIKCTQNTRRKR